MLAAVRQAVKQTGKEAATHRFTLQQKQRLAEIVYAYTRQGCRTSEEEICTHQNYPLTAPDERPLIK